jgi:hypothetical protein
MQRQLHCVCCLLAWYGAIVVSGWMCLDTLQPRLHSRVTRFEPRTLSVTTTFRTRLVQRHGHLAAIANAANAVNDNVNNNAMSVVYTPVWDFSNATVTSNQMDRLDDAIMGGISTSAIRTMPGESFARWSGVCRTDGG